MIDDFFSSKLFPKFYIKTPTKEVFALGKSRQQGDFRVGLVPFYTPKNQINSCFYTPASYSIQPSRDWEMPFFKIPPPMKYRHDESLYSFTQKVHQILDQIHAAKIQKAVLKRQTTWYFENRLDYSCFFKTFCSRNRSVFPFYFQEDPTTAFFGGTPERLFHRQGFHVKTMALAGTIKKGSRCDTSFLNDSKLWNEVNIVKDEIVACLEKRSRWVKASELRVHPLEHLSHLIADIEAELHEIDDVGLIHDLHPTPAIIGHPQQQALELVRFLERTERSLYASVIGFQDQNASDFMVGIRSGILCEKLLLTFAGVGIVRASHPIEEWKELDLKTQPMKIWMPL